jgi:hypothetical protein
MSLSPVRKIESEKITFIEIAAGKISSSYPASQILPDENGKENPDDRAKVTVNYPCAEKILTPLTLSPQATEGLR